MVSTRGPKFKFSEGERVLCYEPDPTKAKVLYDSKVLEVKVNKDQRGRKTVEFLIHFQGWNSSWDRCVSEDYVLKDTEENRQLQQDLAHKAQLQLCSNYRRGAYLYRKDRTKRRRKLSDRINDSLERQKGRRRLSTSASATSNSVASGTSASVDSDDDSLSGDAEEDVNDEDDDERDEEDGSAWGQNSSDESSGAEDDRGSEEVVSERIPITISSGLKTLLEHDNYLITKNNKLLKLPAEPNVVSILEGFVKHCAVNQLCNSHSTSSTNGHSHRHSYKYMNHNKTRDLDAICRNLNTCKEAADGLRVYFDFILNDLLLYSEEKLQFLEFGNDMLHSSQVIKKEPESEEIEIGAINIKVEPSSPDEHSNEQEKDKVPSSQLSPTIRHTKSAEEPKHVSEQNRKRNLRSSHRSVPDPSQSCVTPSSNGLGLPSSEAVQNNASIPKSSPPASGESQTLPSTPSAEPSESVAVPPDAPSPRGNAILSQIMTWRLIPLTMRTEKPTPPSLIYGATHLARLFVRLPDLLYTGTMPKRKLKVLSSHLDTFMRYLEEHTEWFADHNYTDNSSIH